MLVLIDNYDSFTYNLVHYLGELGAPCEVFRTIRFRRRGTCNLPPGALFSALPTPNRGSPRADQ